MIERRIAYWRPELLLGALILVGALISGCENDGGGAGSGHDFGDNNPDLYVALGDSITSGEELPGYSAYPARLSGMLGKTVINAGHGGDKSDNGVSRVNGVLASRKPGYLLILFGVNDKYSASRTKENLRKIIQAAKANKTIPVIATLTPVFRSHSFLEGGIDARNPLIRELAAEEDAILVDLDAAFNWDSTYILPDGLHPNDAGTELIATTFFNALF